MFCFFYGCMLGIVRAIGAIFIATPDPLLCDILAQHESLPPPAIRYIRSNNYLVTASTTATLSGQVQQPVPLPCAQNRSRFWRAPIPPSTVVIVTRPFHVTFAYYPPSFSPFPFSFVTLRAKSAAVSA